MRRACRSGGKSPLSGGIRVSILPSSRACSLNARSAIPHFEKLLYQGCRVRTIRTIRQKGMFLLDFNSSTEPWRNKYGQRSSNVRTLSYRAPRRIKVQIFSTRTKAVLRGRCALLPPELASILAVRTTTKTDLDTASRTLTIVPTWRRREIHGHETEFRLYAFVTFLSSAKMCRIVAFVNSGWHFQQS